MNKIEWPSLACALLLVNVSAAASRQPDSVRVDGTPREFIVASPDRAAGGPRPLVLLLHGHLGTAANVLGAGRAPSPLAAWLDIVDREQILVVAPQGLKGADGKTGWRDCRRDNTNNPRSDDVAFANATVRRLIEMRRADPQRIYAMGMSNGSMMSLRLALEMQPAPVAVAAVAGAMAAVSDCRAARAPVSVLIIHGTADPLSPYGGGTVGFRSRNDQSLGTVLSVAATRDYWLKANKLDSVPSASYTFPQLDGSTTRAVRTTYGDAAGPQVVLLSIENGGHVEPSLRFHYGRLYSRIVGPQSRDLESAEEAWAFFAPKSRR